MTDFITSPGPTQIITIGTQGPPGPPGPAGSGGTFSAIAGETITINTVVVLLSGLLYIADPSNSSHAGAVVGIAITSGDVDNSITVMQSGTISGLSDLSVDNIYYVGLDGSLSTDMVAAGATWFQGLGRPISTTALVLSLGPNVLL